MIEGTQALFHEQMDIQGSMGDHQATQLGIGQVPSGQRHLISMEGTKIQCTPKTKSKRNLIQISLDYFNLTITNKITLLQPKQ